MVQKLISKRPILVGGLGLAASLGLLSGLESTLSDSMTLISLVSVGAGIWWWRHQRPPLAASPLKPVHPTDRDTVEAALAALQTEIATLQQELTQLGLATAASQGMALEARRQALWHELDRRTLKVAIAGAPRSGKTTLRNHLGALDAVPEDAADAVTTDAETTTSAFSLTEVSLTAQTTHTEVMAQLLQQQDAVVYLVTEDLTESHLADLRQLTAAGQRVLLSLNKQDQYLPDDRAAVLGQLRSRMAGLPQPAALGAIATAPNPLKVRTYDPEGNVHERLEDQAADISAVAAQLDAWLTEVPHLVAQTVMRQTQDLRQDLQRTLNQARRRQALPLVEQLQWAAAATAFASPLPSLDMIAAIAINGQLVMDLGRVYQQPLALDQAKTIASELAAIVVKLGVVEVSSQLLSAALKSHAATYAVGGSVQAFSAAYLTRLCGESLMAYFEERALSGQADAALSVSAIGQKLQGLLPSTQRTEFLQSLIKQGMQKLKPKIAPALPPGEAPVLDLPSTISTVPVAQPEPLSSGEIG